MLYLICLVVAWIKALMLGEFLPRSCRFCADAAWVIWQSVKLGYSWFFVVAQQAHDRPNRADTHRRLFCVCTKACRGKDRFGLMQTDCCGFERVYQCLRPGELWHWVEKKSLFIIPITVLPFLVSWLRISCWSAFQKIETLFRESELCDWGDEGLHQRKKRMLI